MSSCHRLISIVVLLSVMIMLVACSSKPDLGYLQTKPAAALMLPDDMKPIRQRSYMVIPDVSADGDLPADDRPPRMSGE